MNFHNCPKGHFVYETRVDVTNDISKYIEREYTKERLAKHYFAAMQNKSCTHIVTRIQKGLSYKTPKQMWFTYCHQAASLKLPALIATRLAA